MPAVSLVPLEELFRERVIAFLVKPRRIPSKKWRELIKKVWEADPLLCPHCQHEPNEER